MDNPHKDLLSTTVEDLQNRYMTKTIMGKLLLEGKISQEMYDEDKRRFPDLYK